MAKQMTWDSRDGCYHGVTSDGQEIIVDGDEYAENEQAARKEGIDESEIESMQNDPDMWANCVGANPNVEYVK